MIVKIHKNGHEVAAICDKGLLGKKFEEGNKQLDLTGDFYKGDEKSREEIIMIMKSAYIVNLVGEETINLALELGIIKPDHIIIIADVKHAQSVRATE